ncbi:dopamine D2-like receptor [Trichonephila clavipes]|nr:dopamine D2-like receptor [Trichonephila clavipes]
MDDNATFHRTLAVQDCLDSEGIQRLVWPARSPDLNPIENVWDALGRQVAGRNYPPTNTPSSVHSQRNGINCLNNCWIMLCKVWFIAVTQPIKYSKHKNNKRIFLTIIFVWLVSAAIGSPIVLGLNTSPERQPNLCVFYNSDFIIYSSLSSFYIPCLAMVYLYYQIFRAIHERARKVIAQKGPTSRQREEKGLVIQNAASTEQQTNSNKDSSKPSQGVSYIKTLSPLIEGDETSQMYHSENADEDEDDEESPTTADCQVISNVAVSSFVNDASPLNDVKVTVPCFRVNGSVVETAGEQKKTKSRFKLVKPTGKSKKKKREKNAARRERKATKTLAIVLVSPCRTCTIRLQTPMPSPGFEHRPYGTAVTIPDVIVMKQLLSEWG